MSGYVNRDCGGWTELRVHGVAGSPPEQILDHPHVHRVAGDADAGFHRRRWEARQTSADTAGERLEAYSWGGLTAGRAQRALWLLLTPFLLANVAYWALPPAADTRTARAARRAADAVQRIFALSLTQTLVLAAIGAAMDLVGRQCAGQTPGCPDRIRGLGFLTWSWLDLPGRQLTVTAVVPLAVVGLLWWLADKTWQQLETTTPPPATGGARHATGLSDPRMWNGHGPVRRLRAVHVTAGFALVATYLLAPFTHGDPSAGRQAAVTGLLAMALGLLALTAVLVCLPQMSDRARTTPAGRRDLYTFLPWAGVSLNILAAALLWQPGVGTTAPEPGPPVTALPWVAAGVQLLAAVQITALLAVLLFLLVLRARGPADDPAPAWFGLTTAVLMMAAAALAVGFAAGLTLTVAHLLGTPAPAGTRADAFIVPLVHLWAAALAVPAAGGALLLATAGLWLIHRRTGAMLRAHVAAAYPDAGIGDALNAPDTPQHAATLRRARAIAANWSRATVGDVGGRVTGAYAAWLALLITAALAGYLIDPHGVHTHARWAVTIGDAIVAGFVAALLYVGRQAYRNPRFRRTVGVLWDLGTFWPRATHPLAPPCYAERAVPDLVRRIRHLGGECDGRVLLSGHSQGSVIAAAVVLQLDTTEHSRVALLTHGSPLRRLYSRFFPVHFGVPALRQTGVLLAGAPDADPARWPWRNLYRLSDPIGGWILHPAHPGDPTGIDLQLVDPVFATPPGDNTYPPIRGHSDYPADPAYRQAARTVRDLRDPAR